MYPQYDIVLESNLKFLMMAEKKSAVKSAYYHITTRKDDLERNSEGYIGKVRSNFGIDQFNIFGEGENPNSGLEIHKIRNQYGSAIYYSRKDVGRPNESFDVIIPKIDSNGNFVEWKPMRVLCYVFV